MSGRTRKYAWIAAALLAGAVLRIAFIAHHPRFAGDALTYGELAHNLLAHHWFAESDPALHATMIRMPGYPAFVAACFAVFGEANYLAVLWVQVVVDLLTCCLLARLAWRMGGECAGMWTLWLAALCPFTANYAAVALAETCSLFCVALAFFALERWRARWTEARGCWWAFVVGVALAWAVFLRPDEGLLAAAVVPVMVWRGRERVLGLRRGAAAVVVTSLCVLLPLGLWGWRNWRVFHVVEPLSPRYANDPGEEVPLGFMRWYKTWAIGYGSTVKVYWQYDGDVVSMTDVPGRAFDSPQQRAETAAIYAEYNEEQGSTPEVDAKFARLAAERVRAHPFAYYVALPVARELDMWLRPRTELMGMPLDWWRWRAHLRVTVESAAYAALNFVYLVLGTVGFARLWRGGEWRWLLCAMALFVVLRCALLLTVDNPEMRYTLECFPVVILCAGFATVRERP